MTESTTTPSKPARKAARPAAKAEARPAARKAAPASAKTAKPAAKRTTAVQKAAALEKAAKKATAQGRKTMSTVLHQTRDASFKLIDSQRAIWLAGLGALANANATTGGQGGEAVAAVGVGGLAEAVALRQITEAGEGATPKRPAQGHPLGRIMVKRVPDGQ